MTNCISEHEHWMELALLQARKAASEDEIPVGAVLVKDRQVILADHNRTRQLSNPLAHAEKLIIDKILASKIKYLIDYTLYVTLEPCLMCAGSMIWSRLGTLVFGASEPKAGAVGSIYNVLADKSFNHHPTVVRGVLQDQCSALLKEFFALKRL
ncbi:MAG TPA: tRNA adenosine(34) deaminase TadA [Candidatus Cloacimonadota bacterium]|nr:tRNA adenosine(34) deaminase TadA [Candidatus Cloacimonadota bacterium]HQH50340.1 tRNA adenosine(34) deaminase TadA [Candidatus Cloacimonadota bacterium]